MKQYIYGHKATNKETIIKDSIQERNFFAIIREETGLDAIAADHILKSRGRIDHPTYKFEYREVEE